MSPGASETARFVDIFDKFFDAVNVANFDSAKRERKPFKNPYRCALDFRLKVSKLKGDILELMLCSS